MIRYVRTNGASQTAKNSVKIVSVLTLLSIVAVSDESLFTNSVISKQRIRQHCKCLFLWVLCIVSAMWLFTSLSWSDIA